MFQSVDPELFDIFSQGHPLIDVRAPVEFSAGHLPGAVNLPVLNDEERAAVGTMYKQKGQDAAIELGQRLVSGETKQRRLEAWADYIKEHPDSIVHCFRGGLRSRSVVLALKVEMGISVPQLRGGYKRARNYLMRVLELAADREFIVVGGLTGSGKTTWIEAHWAQSIDLEHHAHHRGSALGKKPEGQPTQINFENELAVDFLRREKVEGPLILEDEGRLIGTCVLPESLFNKMRTSPLFVIDTDRATRAENLVEIYLSENFGFKDGVVPEHIGAFREFTTNNLKLIEKRLGGTRLKALFEAFQLALEEQKRSGAFSAHHEWVSLLLEWYYDPMYEYQLKQPHKKVVWRGSANELEAALSRSPVSNPQSRAFA